MATARPVATIVCARSKVLEIIRKSSAKHFEALQREEDPSGSGTLYAVVSVVHVTRIHRAMQRTGPRWMLPSIVRSRACKLLGVKTI